MTAPNPARAVPSPSDYPLTMQGQIDYLRAHNAALRALLARCEVYVQHADDCPKAMRSGLYDSDTRALLTDLRAALGKEASGG